MTTHLIIPDCQVKDGVPLDHLEWVGRYIVHKKPDVIINIGDFADMPSLSSYDKGKKSFEGRRYRKDIESAHKAQEILLGPMRRYNELAAKQHRAQYRPRMVLTLGNHEDRITRAIESQAELDGVLSINDLRYKEYGWEVYDFLKPVQIDGVYYAHYFVNPSSLKKLPLSGQMETKLKNTGHSFTMGHQQQLQYGLRHLANGITLHGLVAGACYLHDEEYLGPQGNNYWRGIIMCHNVKDGTYDPMFVSLDFLKHKYTNL